MLGREIRVKRSNVVQVEEPPTYTSMHGQFKAAWGAKFKTLGPVASIRLNKKIPGAPTAAVGCRIQDPGTHGYRWWKTADFSHSAGTPHKPRLVGTEQPTVPHTGGKDPVADIPDTLPGNWYQVLGVRYPRATTEEIKRAYKQLTVKVHPDKNAHHKEKAEELFKQIAKAKDGLLNTEARRRHDADIHRGTKRQQREVHQGNRGAATHGPEQEGRRLGEPNTLMMQRRFAYVTVDFMEAQHISIVRTREWQLAHTPMPSMTKVVLHMPRAHDAGGPGAHRGRRSVPRSVAATHMGCATHMGSGSRWCT